MPEVVKYLSPVALLAIIWAIVQFYQIRADKKREKDRNEKVEVYASIHSILGDIEFKVFKFIWSSNVPLKNAVESFIKMNKSLQIFSEELSSFESEISLTEQMKNPNEKNVEEIRRKIDCKKNKLDKLDFKTSEISKQSVIELDRLFLELTLTLETRIEDLNKVPLLLMKNKNSLKIAIFKLTNDINTILENFYSKKQIDGYGFAKSEYLDQIKNIFYSIIKIKTIIDQDLNKII